MIMSFIMHIKTTVMGQNLPFVAQNPHG
jgi:hypothetical protein